MLNSATAATVALLSMRLCLKDRGEVAARQTTRRNPESIRQ
jgi:hypothetical protein